jgi:hypothetical protein
MALGFGGGYISDTIHERTLCKVPATPVSSIANLRRTVGITTLHGRKPLYIADSSSIRYPYEFHSRLITP